MLSALPLTRFRLHGIRKLNWVERGWDEAYDAHLRSCGFESWIEPGLLLIVVGPNGCGKSTVVDLLQALSNASLWPGLPRENYPGADFSGFEAEGADFALTVRFSKYTETAAETFDAFTALAVAERDGTSFAFHSQLPKYGSDGGWRHEVQSLLDQAVGIEVRHQAATGQASAALIDDAVVATAPAAGDDERIWRNHSQGREGGSLAARYRRDMDSWEQCDLPPAMILCVERLLGRIRGWQSPQELITTAFLPPFLEEDLA